LYAQVEVADEFDGTPHAVFEGGYSDLFAYGRMLAKTRDVEPPEYDTWADSFAKAYLAERATLANLPVAA
jgi:hypothetical protein